MSEPCDKCKQMGGRLWGYQAYCANKNVFSSYSSLGDGEEQVYLGDSRITPVLGREEFLLKLTYGNTLALSDVLHVSLIRVNWISCTIIGKGEGQSVIRM